MDNIRTKRYKTASEESRKLMKNVRRKGREMNRGKNGKLFKI